MADTEEKIEAGAYEDDYMPVDNVYDALEQIDDGTTSMTSFLHGHSTEKSDRQETV